VPVLVDGNNAAHHLPGVRGDRGALRRRVLELARRSRITVAVVFDGPPPAGTPAVERLGAVTIRYAGGRSADDVIVAGLPRGAAARQWTVVTDDRGLAARVCAAGARVEPVAAFFARTASSGGRAEKPERPSEAEIAEWLDLFGGERVPAPDGDEA